mmetsp:Transcript_95634/g.303629  ORF Transcript_95634/g.303629 Transcript_95634/m.303629 type:complete len:80 (-) Transcript_95634:131-370(-)
MPDSPNSKWSGTGEFADLVDALDVEFAPVVHRGAAGRPFLCEDSYKQILKDLKRAVRQRGASPASVLKFIRDCYGEPQK